MSNEMFQVNNIITIENGVELLLVKMVSDNVYLALEVVDNQPTNLGYLLEARVDKESGDSYIEIINSIDLSD